MTEIENSDPSATPSHASNHEAAHAPYTAPDYAPGGGVLPSLTKTALNTLCDTGVISTVAWQRAVEFCGFRPDGKAWLAYWRQMLLLGGALFFGSSSFDVEFMKPLRPESGPQSGRPW